LLAQRYANDNLAQIITPIEHYRPFPTASHRAAWDALSEELRQGQLAAGEGHLGMDWPALPATLFMQYARTGNRRNFEAPSLARRLALADLVIAECIEFGGRFIDDIVNGIWCICEESFWGVPAHNWGTRLSGSPLPDTADRMIDLFAGETGALLAWAHYLLSEQLDAVHPVVCDRVRREMRERILGPYLERNDYSWMGLGDSSSGARVNNWNPWCNGNCLMAALLLEDDPERRVAAVAKALRSIDRFIDSYLPDGGCDEGTSYWGRAGASLFDCLELLASASGGQINVYDDPLIANMGRYLYRMHISGDYFVNFADGGAKVGIAHDLVHRYGRAIHDPQLIALGSSTHHRRQAEKATALGASGLYRRLHALFNYPELDAGPADPPYVGQAWLDGIEVMTAREQDGSDKGLFLAAKGGHNAESHNHNDVGQFIVYHDGTPVIIDVGVEAYTAKTFSAQRYEIWTMQSVYHNLPTVNGVQQAPGVKSAARDALFASEPPRVGMSMDIAAAYPEEAHIRSWRRTCSLLKEPTGEVTIRDQFELSQPSEVTLSLMTCREPRIEGAGTLVLGGDTDIAVQFDAEALQATIERIEITDARLLPVWGDHLFRVLLSTRQSVSEGDWTLRIGPSLT